MITLGVSLVGILGATLASAREACAVFRQS